MDSKHDFSKFSLLLVDDEPLVLSSLKRTFLNDPFEIHTAENGDAALELLKAVPVNAALIDLKMPGMGGLALLKKLKHQHPHLMVIILTGHGGVAEAVQAIHLGAVDFLEKPFSPEGLRARISRLHDIWRLQRENRKLRRELDSTFGYERLVGNSTAILKLKQLISRVARGDASILISGETGVGKELVARAIHHNSPRAEGPFVPVDCAAISEAVIESEMFGHTKGAFTGAFAPTLGLIRAADGGTLFLDEVGELSKTMQVKLLRTIQEREVRPVGSIRSFSVNIRLLAATNRDLPQEVLEGRFREDLLYRLKVVHIAVPPLRNRREDIPLLARHFVKRSQGDAPSTAAISPRALAAMEQYAWPGNVRELQNAIERALALGVEEQIDTDNLPRALRGGHPEPDLPGGETLAAYEKTAIRNALKNATGNRRKAALILGLSEATLYRKIKLYGLKS
jgi:DNA-binding NtrC family response regulator